MTDRPPDVRDLVGDEVPPEELERLRRVDALLRSVPAAPPTVPRSLADAVRAIPSGRRRRSRVALALAFAAALVALSFAAGFFAGRGEDLDERYRVAMEPTRNAAGASAVVRVGEPDEETGNVELELEVSGLPKLPKGGYYVLWLAKDGEYAATCGTFNVAEGETSVYMNVSYDLQRYDAWVITAQVPGRPADAPRPWLLTAPI